MTAVLVQLPSLIIDAVREDALDATQATLTSTLSEPFALADGQTLTLDTDTAAGQTVTFDAVNFFDIGEATAEEVALSLTAALDGATASVDEDGNIVLTSSTYGTTALLEVTGGTAAAVFAFPAGPVTGDDATAQYVVINRLPEPDETEVPVDQLIDFTIFSSDGTAPALVDVTVYVNGVEALSGGTFQTGFQGAGSTSSNPDSGTLRIIIDPQVDFDSDELVDVQVLVGALDETWSFTSADTTPPEVLSAVAQDTTTVRVTFTEPLTMTSVSGGALDPAAYTIERVSTFAVGAEVVAVNQVDASTVDLTTDVILTFGATYTVTAGEEIEDERGNVLAGAPNNGATFTGYNPEVPDGRKFQLWDWIPGKNRREDATRDLYKLVHVIQELTNVQLHLIDKFADILDPDTAPESFVDAMLADLGNPFRYDMDLADKRRLVRVLVEIYKMKGTEVGLTSVINFLLGVEVTVRTWVGVGWVLDEDTLDDESYLGPSTARQLYSFEIVSPVTLTAEQRSRMWDIGIYMKGAQEHLVRIVEPTTPESQVTVNHGELGYSRLGVNWKLH